MAISLQGDADSVLDRLEIPDDVRQKVSERLTPGSSLIIGDTAINSATLPKGADRRYAVEEVSLTVRAREILCLVAQPRKKKKKRVRRSRRRNNYSFSPPPVRRGFPAWPF